MARFDTSFDATSVEPTTAYELLPAGKYRAQIVESEMRVTRNGMGQFLWLMLDILDGEQKGRKIFDQLNLVNPNPTTVEIAQRTLSAICHATGQLQVADSEQLHFRPMLVSVKFEPEGHFASYSPRTPPCFHKPPRVHAHADDATPAPRSRRSPSVSTNSPIGTSRSPASPAQVSAPAVTRTRPCSTCRVACPGLLCSASSVPAVIAIRV